MARHRAVKALAVSINGRRVGTLSRKTGAELIDGSMGSASIERVE